MGVEEAEAGAAESPYALARRLHQQGVNPAEIERQLLGLGLDAADARIAARAGRGEAGVAPTLESLRPPPVAELPTEPPGVAPTHPCPRHAAWPVAASCSRCGNFFCTKCVTEAGLTRLPESGQCPECERRAPVRAGIAGWLVLPAINVSLGGPITAIASILQDFQSLYELEGPVTAPLYVEMLFYTGYLLFSVFTATQFFGRKKRAVPLMIAFYAAGMFSVLLGAVLIAWMEALLGQPIESKADGSEVRAIVGGVIWIAYFLRSQRVKQTFTFD
jgi:hypothetical protein